ncbi:flavin-containing monooxygenase [Aspergillus clavatus NRRL 1]|uniref:Flavin-binding monooxygenase, putative n=1 Tax=Aspergillus clavatus (strain ATCC 1007 / CBS 513.65 / DSM 816 / NCTC 3887 / NRRL 1 / QM 1276 / 107) TaxID=344612 RepID=A1CUL6_ASPCL|nr:flavin-binding monooxygenase, putative [Aspergillus clavatus NRRL 1]EAW07003.1 flavin-binding monooxygenase, putative [Aspergillus clavatus NRRL 1]
MPSNESFSVPNGDAHVHNDWAIHPSRFAFTPQRMRVVCIGAGFSGLILAHKLKHERPMEFVDLTIYEKNTDVGGTWFENVYQGVGCDIPSHSYIFPFEPNPSWSKFYVNGPEIQQYILNTTKKYGLREMIIFNTKLVHASWSEKDGKWKLRLEQNGSIINDEADVVLDASGILNQWKWPDIEGLHSFGGKLVHTARWDPDYDWTDKKIAVIGNGSSALQVVPALQPKAARIVNYIRHATWVSTNLCGNLTKDGMGTNFEFTEEEKQRVNTVFRLMLSDSEDNKFLLNLVDGAMRARLSKSSELAEKLIPKYEIGCRRLSPGDGYLEALQADNADICFSGIQRITGTGIETEAGVEEFDLIVCATGFNTTFIPAWELVGREGRRLSEEWKEKPEAYFSVCAAGYPNYFMFAGPNCPIGHGSVPQMLSWTADYMLDWVAKMATEDIKSVAVRDSVVRDYNTFAQENLKRAVWSKGCHAWYSKKNKGDSNTVTAMYPGSVLHFKAFMRNIRGEHFDIRYNTTNPFRYLGNGELAFERAEGADLAFYLK